MYLPATGLGAVTRGLGDCGCGGQCGGHGSCLTKSPGLGSYGLGLFDSMDFTTWGVGEWSIVAFAGFALFSMFSTTKRGVGKVKRTVRKSRKSRKSALLREASAL